MDLNMFAQKLKALEFDEAVINEYLSYAQTLKCNGVPVIFELEHLRKLLHLSKEDFFQIYYSLNHQYHQVYIPKNKLLYTNNKFLKGNIGKKLNSTTSKYFFDNSMDPKKRYKRYNKLLVQKLNEKKEIYRKLDLPSKKLKYIQRFILENILYKIDVHKAAHGFVPKRSTISNAETHVGKEFVVKLDLKDFFPSISAKRVYGLFRSIGYNKSVSYALTKLCTYRNYLPQGAPTSPYISNLITRKLDSRISILCEKNNLTYSRYADDITISGGKKVKSILSIIKDIIKTEGFILNNEKTKVLHNSYKQQVTGVIVNKKLSIPKDMYKKIRQELYYMGKFGVTSHLSRKKTLLKSNTKAYYYGIVHYCSMIDPVKSEKLYDLIEKIDWRS